MSGVGLFMHVWFCLSIATIFSTSPFTSTMRMLLRFVFLNSECRFKKKIDGWVQKRLMVEPH